MIGSFKVFHIDAFTTNVFSGNAACVVVLKESLPYDILLRIAAENAVAETAFITEQDNYTYKLRWFTPDLEIDLCGHATLAAAFVVENYLKKSNYIATKEEYSSIRFITSEGEIVVDVQLECGETKYILNFPIREAKKSSLPPEIYESLSIKPKEVYLSRDYMLVYDSVDDIKNIKIDRDLFDKINLGCGGVIITASGGESSDFVSRFFTPQASILEDPVTGSAHCTLVPFWANRLLKKELLAKQISNRGGVLECKLLEDRVLIKGSAVCYSNGEINI